MVGAWANLGGRVSAQTVGNILKQHGMPPAPERRTRTIWKEFIRTSMDVLVARAFCTTEVWTWDGRVMLSGFCFIHVGSRRVHMAGVTPFPHASWMMQIARHVTMEDGGFFAGLLDGHQLAATVGPDGLDMDVVCQVLNPEDRANRLESLPLTSVARVSAGRHRARLERHRSCYSAREGHDLHLRLRW